MVTAGVGRRASAQPAGGISTRLTTWITPFVAITSGFVTFAALTKTFMPETRMRTDLPLSVFAEVSFVTSASRDLAGNDVIEEDGLQLRLVG